MPSMRPEARSRDAGDYRPIIFDGYGSRGRDIRSSSSPRYVTQLKLTIQVAYRLLSMRFRCCHSCVVIATNRSITSFEHGPPNSAMTPRNHRSFLTKRVKTWQTVAEFSLSAQALNPSAMRRVDLVSSLKELSPSSWPFCHHHEEQNWSYLNPVSSVEITYSHLPKL